MNERRWPYDLPIWRSQHRAESRHGLVAEIADAREVSMGNPTRGTLRVAGLLELDACNPAFIWSNDGRYLAVPRYTYVLGLVRRQRLLVIDVDQRTIHRSRQGAWYFQPETFTDGILVATRNPSREAQKVAWRIPAELASFAPLDVAWTPPT